MSLLKKIILSLAPLSRYISIQLIVSFQVLNCTVGKSEPLKVMDNFFIKFKVAPYSFTIAGALGTKVQLVICAYSKGNVSVFLYFITSTWEQKAKLTVNFLKFPSVKFPKIWQIVNKYFTLVGTRFPGKSIRPVFWQR